ncbi:MAG: endonuclease/exonuclease/phosphatase family protein [Planctomycetota bacterium]
MARAVSWLSTAAVAALAAAALLILSARWTVVGELASHFRWHVGLAAAGAALPAACLRHRRRAALLLAVALWGVLPEGRLWIGARPLEARQPALDLVCANVLQPNTRYEEVLDAIQAQDADVVCLVEVNSHWRERALATLGDRYPHHLEGGDTADWWPSTWGLLLLSRTPLTRARVEELMNEGRRLRPILCADVELDGEPVTVQLAHAQRPGRAWRLSDRRRHFEALVRPRDAEHLVVLGDLNTTSSSPLFAELCRDARVRDSRAGYGRLPTWTSPRGLLRLGPLRAPRRFQPAFAIDHALVSEGLVVLGRGTFDIPGSDHDGVHVRVGLAKAPPR